MKETAQTIINQLGGNKFVVMTGSKNFSALTNGVCMDLSKNKSGANRLEITLNGQDLYDMRFYKYTSAKFNKNTMAFTSEKIKEITNINDIFSDNLQSVFTKVTGMYTHL